jgi:ankyrin repeat protein
MSTEGRDKARDKRLFDAVLSDNAVTLKQALADEANRLLQIACSTNKPQSTRTLLEQGADVSSRQSDWYAWTALHTAAHFSTDCIPVLLAAAANIEAQDDNGKRPLHLAAQKHLERVRLLVEAGASLNPSDWRGWRPLHYAALSDAGDVVAFLLKQAGIEVNAVSNDGRSPLHIACEYGNVNAVVELLKQPHIDVDLQT